MIKDKYLMILNFNSLYAAKKQTVETAKSIWFIIMGWLTMRKFRNLRVPKNKRAQPIIFVFIDLVCATFILTNDNSKIIAIGRYKYCYQFGGNPSDSF